MPGILVWRQGTESLGRSWRDSAGRGDAQSQTAEAELRHRADRAKLGRMLCCRETPAHLERTEDLALTIRERRSNCAARTLRRISSVRSESGSVSGRLARATATVRR